MTPAGKSQCRASRFLRRQILCGRSVFLIDSSCTKGLSDAMPAVAPLRKQTRFRHRIEGVIDQAASRYALHQRLDFGLSVTIPAALANLAIQIVDQLGPRRCKLAHVEKGEFVEAFAV